MIGSPVRSHSILFKIAPTKGVRNLVECTKRFELSSVAKERLKIINFYNTHGEKTTFEAFSVGRKTISIWKRRFKLKGLTGLIPYSTKPKNVRCIQVDPTVLSFIKNLRQKYGNLGKSKIKTLLDQFCLKENLSTLKPRLEE